ncbi:ATP-binding protein [Flavobacterium endoglycinae]|uniref:ATP-binding protein n=1 Tax=Flavobacterium endoglycinae TaxID=2816357 RepID=A0ABX7QGI5_9FLAO|nr:ATP-binding protein [Flavobacterium endoglycinae]QSW89588.1 ATP-binding protein [Flavobacterium endoglycinae]
MDLNDIKNYIENKIEENLNLDYKASGSLQKSDAKTNEISKDVSAFANSDGGIIVYGIKEHQINRHLPDSIDPVDRKLISKEWLEQIIQSKIRPRIDGIIIHSITVDENSDQVVYAVEIPKSNTAHQAHDKRYYKRFNFNSEPMYDYEIRDVLNRTKAPIIDIELEIIKTTREIKKPFGLPEFTFGQNGKAVKAPEPVKEYKTQYTLRVYARNTGKILANYLNAYLKIPEIHLTDDYENQNGITNLFMENTIRDIVDSKWVADIGGGYSIPKYGPSRYDPILPTRSLMLKDIKIQDSVFDSDIDLEWVVYCDNAEPRNGSHKISNIKIFNE